MIHTSNISTTPVPIALASTCNLNGISKFGAERTGALQRMSLAAKNKSSQSGVQTKLLESLRRSVRGDTKFLQNPL